MNRVGLPLACAVLLAALSGLACGTTYPTQRSISPELTAHAVVVYPVGFHELDAELVRHQRLLFANPALDPGARSRLSRMSAGLYVLETPSGGKLAPGELVLSLEGGPALPQALARVRFSPPPSRPGSAARMGTSPSASCPEPRAPIRLAHVGATP